MDESFKPKKSQSFVGHSGSGAALLSFGASHRPVSRRCFRSFGCSCPWCDRHRSGKRTQFTRSTVTTSAGTYTLAYVPVGSYRLTVSAPNFKSATTDASVNVDQQLEINFDIGLAQVTSAIEVSAAPPLLTTTNATLGRIVTGQQVATLPLNGRDVSNLMLLQPGTAAGLNAALAHTQYPGVNWVSNNGSRANYTTSYLDGIDTTDNEMGGAQLTNFNLDAIAEFEVVQNNFSAKYGRGSSMVVALVSKSGTNQFHGDLLEFLRNTNLDARNFFSATVPPLQRNEFGGTIGGPIIKNRTFFFFEYAGLRQVSGPPVNVAVPTADERQGKEAVTVNGTPQVLLVPVTPAAQAVLSAYPMPNNPIGPFGARTYTVNLKTPIDESQYSIRIDHRFSDNDSLFGRFTYSNNAIPIFSTSLAAINPQWSDSRHWNVRNLGITETHLLSPNAINSLTLSWLRTIETDSPSTVTDQTISTFSDGLLSNWGPYRAGFINEPDEGVLNDNLTIQKGRHALNAGVEYRIRSNSEAFPGSGYVNGVYTFKPGTTIPVAIPTANGGRLPAGSASPNSIVSLMLGVPFSVAQSGPFPGFGVPGSFTRFTLKDWQIDGWIQDDIKVTTNLTLNLGLRYEFNSVPREEDGRITAIDQEFYAIAVESAAVVVSRLYGMGTSSRPGVSHVEEYGAARRLRHFHERCSVSDCREPGIQFSNGSIGNASQSGVFNCSSAVVCPGRGSARFTGQCTAAERQFKTCAAEHADQRPIRPGRAGNGRTYKHIGGLQGLTQRIHRIR